MSVSHLPCPLPPNHLVICLAPYHCVTASPRHRISQPFALPPATKPFSYLPCSLPPHHRVTVPPRHRITVPPRHRATAPPCHRVTVPPHHRVTVSPCHCVTAPPYHRVSQPFALPPATKPFSYLPRSLSPCHRATASPRQSAICLAPCHQTI